MNAYNSITPETIQEDMRYLQLLSHSFPTIADASTEIINLEAILNLPKGTEHFLADLHGEYEAFQHVLRNASGAIKRKVRVGKKKLSANNHKPKYRAPEHKICLVSNRSLCSIRRLKCIGCFFALVIVLSVIFVDFLIGIWYNVEKYVEFICLTNRIL